MKSIEELKALRDKARESLTLQEGDCRIIVGLATCGIAAGARPVFNEIAEEVKTLGLNNVTVAQAGCLGMCALEPIVQVYKAGEETITYCKVKPDMVSRIITEHIVNGNPVTEFTYGAYVKD